MSTRLTGQQILDLPMGDNTADARTVRDYLIKLLRELWQDSGSFTGKYAFGSSDWQYDLYQALADAGLITAKFDENGYFEECDTESGGRLIASAIDALGRWTPMAGETLPGLRDMLSGLPRQRVPFEQATEASYGRLYDAYDKFKALHAEAAAEVERLRKEAADLGTTLTLVGQSLSLVGERAEQAETAVETWRADHKLAQAHLGQRLGQRLEATVTVLGLARIATEAIDEAEAEVKQLREAQATEAAAACRNIRRWLAIERERDQLKATLDRVRTVHHLEEWVSLSSVCHQHHAFKVVEPTPETIAIADACHDCQPERYMGCVCADSDCPVLAAFDQPKEGDRR